MNNGAVIFLLSACIGILACVVVYQRFAFRRGTREKLRALGGELKEIVERDESRRVMVFTENKELMELAAQINALLEKYAGTKTDYQRTREASKKMLSNISHDIKTPMTVILGYLEIMQLKGNASDEMLDKVRRKAENVLELTDQFFTLSRIESGDMELEVSGMDVCEICRESVLDYYELLTEREFQVKADIPEKAVYVWGNREALRRILSNLISNAIRYGGEGKYLGLSVKRDEKAVYVCVTDKGRGIDAAFGERIFDRLFTMEDSRSRQIQGNGLGLSIAKSLAERLGGTLTLESEPYAKTTFTLALKERNL